jgi:hypothetical protein
MLYEVVPCQAGVVRISAGCRLLWSPLPELVFSEFKHANRAPCQQQPTCASAEVEPEHRTYFHRKWNVSFEVATGPVSSAQHVAPAGSSSLACTLSAINPPPGSAQLPALLRPKPWVSAWTASWTLSCSRSAARYAARVSCAPQATSRHDLSQSKFQKAPAPFPLMITSVSCVPAGLDSRWRPWTPTLARQALIDHV